MNGKQLRASILQEAITGRLVPQDPNDEPASELLHRINPKATPLETDQPLPQGWCAVKVKDVCLFENGYAFSSQDYRNKGTPIIRISDLVNNKVELSRCVHYQGKIDERFWVSKGDLLIALSGATTGKMGVYVSDDKAYLNQRVGNLKVIDQRILSCEYRNLFMRSKVGEILRLAYGGAQPNISGKTISDFIFPLPPLAEQKRIVAKLEELMPLVDEYEKAQEEFDNLNAGLKSKLRASLLQEAIAGRLVPQDPNDEPASELLKSIREEKAWLVKEGKLPKDKNETLIFRGDDKKFYEQKGKTVTCIDDQIPFEIPDSWEWERWGNISLSIQYGYNAPALPTGDIKMVRISDIHDNKVSWESVPYCKISQKEIENYLLKPNDILFARTGGTIGKSYLVTSVPEKAVYAGYLIRTQYSNLLSPVYMKSFMESSLYWEQLREGTIATAQPNCNGKRLSRMLIPLPPLAEQKRIVEKLESMFAVLDNLDALTA